MDVDDWDYEFYKWMFVFINLILLALLIYEVFKTFN